MAAAAIVYEAQRVQRERFSRCYDVGAGHNFYSDVDAGVEVSRHLPKGSLDLRLGLRQALSGTSDEASYTSRLLERSYQKKSRMDKTHFVASLNTETEFALGWQLNAEAAFQKGAHDKDLTASIQLKRLWQKIHGSKMGHDSR